MVDFILYVAPPEGTSTQPMQVSWCWHLHTGRACSYLPSLTPLRLFNRLLTRLIMRIAFTDCGKSPSKTQWSLGFGENDRVSVGSDVFNPGSRQT